MHKYQELNFDSVKALKQSNQSFFPKINHSSSNDNIVNVKYPTYISSSRNQTKITTLVKNTTGEMNNPKVKKRSPSKVFKPYNPTTSKKMQSTSQTQSDAIKNGDQRPFYGSFYNYRQMFKVSVDSQQTQQNSQNVLLRNTQSIIDQTQLSSDSQESPKHTSKALMNNFKNRLKALLHQKDLQRHQTIKQRDPRCYNLKSPSQNKIQLMIINSERIQKKMKTLIYDLHQVLESKVKYPEDDTHLKVIVTLTKLRDEFKYMCQDYNDFYSEKEQQQLDPNFYHDFLKNMIKELKQRPSQKNSLQLFNEFVSQRWDPDQDIADQEAEIKVSDQVVEQKSVTDILITPITIPIPIPPPLPVNREVRDVTPPSRTTSTVHSNVSKSQQKKRRKFDKPRDSLVTISSPGGVDKSINKKKRNTQQLSGSDIKQSNSRRQSIAIPTITLINENNQKISIKEENTSQSDSDSFRILNGQHPSRARSFVRDLPNRQRIRGESEQHSTQLQQIEPDQNNISEIIPYQIDAAKIRQLPQRPTTRKNSAQEIIQVQLDFQPEIFINREEQFMPIIEQDNQPLILSSRKVITQKKTVQIIQKKINIVPFKYKEEIMKKEKQSKNQTHIKTQLLQNKRLSLAYTQRLSLVQLQFYQPNLMDLMLECENIFLFDLDNQRNQEVISKETKTIWFDDMQQMIEGLDIIKVEI